MQTINNIFNNQIGRTLTKPFNFLISSGVNPYIIFILLVIIVFLLYFLIFYGGNLKLFKKSFNKMTPAKRRVWFIFLFCGIFIALVFFYESLDLFYGQNGVEKYHSSFIDNNLSNFVSMITSFLERAGIIK